MDTILTVGTFCGLLALLADVLGVAGILLGEAEKGINGLLVYTHGVSIVKKLVNCENLQSW